MRNTQEPLRCATLGWEREPLSANAAPQTCTRMRTQCVHSLEWRKKHSPMRHPALPHAHWPKSATAHLEVPAECVRVEQRVKRHHQAHPDARRPGAPYDNWTAVTHPAGAPRITPREATAPHDQCPLQVRRGHPTQCTNIATPARRGAKSESVIQVRKKRMKIRLIKPFSFPGLPHAAPINILKVVLVQDASS
jgi:hypothetical protein